MDLRNVRIGSMVFDLRPVVVFAMVCFLAGIMSPVVVLYLYFYLRHRRIVGD